MEEEICKLPEWYKNILGLDINRVITNPEQIKAILDSMRERGKVLEWGRGKKYDVLDYEDSPYLSFKPFPKIKTSIYICNIPIFLILLIRIIIPYYLKWD